MMSCDFVVHSDEWWRRLSCAPANDDEYGRSNGVIQQCILTLDVEDHHLGEEGHEPRFRQALEPLLELMSERNIRATFFVVGELASAWKVELGQLAALGHEIGLHGYTHRHLKSVGEHEFRDELRRGSAELADITGVAPIGFRAPYFSLTAKTPWAPTVLAEEGFRYSSSVLPAYNPQAGLPGAPKTPFRWASSGLVEFPAPVFGLGRAALPLLGGAYVRLAPRWLVSIAARRSATHPGSWTYVHPYDLDVGEPYHQLDGQSAVVARLLFARRHLMLDRVAGLCGADAGRLCDLATDEDFVAGLPSFGASVAMNEGPG